MNDKELLDEEIDSSIGKRMFVAFKIVNSANIPIEIGINFMILLI
jgi:hypothetical protein